MEPLKNIFDEKAILHLAAQFELVGIKAKPYFTKILPKILHLELKERVGLISDVLSMILPNDPSQAFVVIHKVLVGKKLNGFILWPISLYVEKVGQKHIDLSMKLLYEITKLFTSEFAIRSFISNHPHIVYPLLQEWCLDESEHVRRLCSEGSRPKLPWGLHLKHAIINPQDGIKILEKLKYDESLYVRKSVANHINDISKDHPKSVITLLQNWKKESPKIHRLKIDWIIKHGLRTLIKRGNPKALKLLGVDHKAQVRATQCKLSSKKIKIGTSTILTGQLHNQDNKSHSVIIDYKIHFLRFNKEYSEKVFKGLKTRLNPNEKKYFKISIPFKLVTTRKYHLGKQKLDLLINSNLEFQETIILY